jgi:hypothetical protein
VVIQKDFMITTSIEQRPNAEEKEIPKTFSLKWSQFDLRESQSQGSIIKGTVENTLLKGTDLSCTTNSEAGQWKNRKIFMEKVSANIIAECPKDEPLVLISLGADRLLIEYILGKILIENGFREISFFLVDPSYVFSEGENQKAINDVLKDFRTGIESIYLNTHKEHFAKERIRYLSRSQNIAKYFPPNSNVAVIESLPPYAELIKDMQKYKVPEKKPEDLLVGGRIVPLSHANAVAFIPNQYAEQLNRSGAKLKDSLPLALFKSAQSKTYFCIDWGCKIQADGTYRLSFSGEEHYFESLGVPKDQRVELATGEIVTVDQWIPIIKKSIEHMLFKQIEDITGGTVQKQLSQKNITVLLEKVKQIAMRYMPGLNCFFLADYVLDRAEAMTFVSSHASLNYRKVFKLIADVDTSYKVTVDDLSTDSCLLK